MQIVYRSEDGRICETKADAERCDSLFRIQTAAKPLIEAMEIAINDRMNTSTQEIKDVLNLFFRDPNQFKKIVYLSEIIILETFAGSVSRFHAT